MGVTESTAEASVETFDDFGSDGAEDFTSASSDDSGGFDAFEDDLPDSEDLNEEIQSSLLDEKNKQDGKAKKDDRDDEDQDDSDDSEEEGEDSSEEEDEDSDKAEEVAKNIKKSKGKFGEESFDIPDEATFAVPVKGKKEFPTLKDLKDNYSGKIAYTEKFDEISRENFKIKAEKEAVDSDKSQLMEHVSNIRSLVDPANSEKYSPFASMEYLCNLTGQSPFEYNKRMIEHYAPVIEQLLSSSESERDAYFDKMEVNYLKNNQAAAAKRNQELESHKEQDLEFKGQLESLGVSEDDFSIGAQELKANGYEDAAKDKKAVLHYLKVKPLYAMAAKVSKKYDTVFSDEDFANLNDDLVKHMMEDPANATKESLEAMLSDLFDLPDEIVEQIKEKVPTKPIKKKKKTEFKFESFNDLD